ncbi:MAG: hypothetical protein JSU85_12710 [Candidatus Zixiibacteriota bacterium]|nr:MAG: hypothetical protein JSU85_12710 [candidate division Zixibacteria bacterium]
MNLLSSNYFRLIIIIFVSLIGALWLIIKDPIPVIRGTTALDEIVPFWYMVSAFPVLGMLVADLLSAFKKSGFARHTVLLFSQIFILMLISNIRLSLKIPISGHAFLFAFFIFNRIFTRDFENLFSRVELTFTITLLLIIGYIKLAWWNDPLTLFIGIIAGVALALITAIFNLNRASGNSAQ